MAVQKVPTTDVDLCFLLDEWIAQQEAIETEKGKVLRSLGWEYKCDTPGAMWLWHKTLEDGRTLAVGTGEALHIEMSILPTGDYPDEY